MLTDQVQPHPIMKKRSATFVLDLNEDMEFYLRQRVLAKDNLKAYIPGEGDEVFKRTLHCSLEVPKFGFDDRKVVSEQHWKVSHHASYILTLQLLVPKVLY